MTKESYSLFLFNHLFFSINLSGCFLLFFVAFVYDFFLDFIYLKKLIYLSMVRDWLNNMSLTVHYQLSKNTIIRFSVFLHYKFIPSWASENWLKLIAPTLTPKLAPDYWRSILVHPDPLLFLRWIQQSFTISSNPSNSNEITWISIVNGNTTWILSRKKKKTPGHC